MIDTIKGVITPIHKEGYPFIIIAVVITLLLLAIAEPMGWIAVVLTAFCIYFFRNPERVVPDREGLLVSPADGVVQKIEKVLPPSEIDLGTEKLTRISIFLNVFDVHVNRVPIGGKVTQLHYHPGKFFNAELDKASDENERQLVVVTTENDKEVAFVQIAGLVARRIVCDLVEGQEVQTGERFGLIRFGSRMDIYLPKGVNPLVVVGQRAVGGETLLADMKSKEKTREGRRD